MDREVSPVAVDKALSPALAKTNKRFRGAILPPLMVLMLGNVVYDVLCMVILVYSVWCVVYGV
ncbi:hypothetical protein EON63_22945 [archaeon]|nr:MAG: hypothetical protein EON63_22945 [archaeon]